MDFAWWFGFIIIGSAGLAGVVFAVRALVIWFKKSPKGPTQFPPVTP